MNTQKLNNLMSELYKFDSSVLELNNPIASSQLIKEFENMFDVILPQEYKDLLSIHNGIFVMGDGILGIDLDNRRDLYNTYYFEHFEVENSIPRYLIPFSPDGFGNHYCFDTRVQTNDGYSYQIVFWQHDYLYNKGEDLEVTHESLTDFIREVMIDWILEDYDYNGNEK